MKLSAKGVYLGLYQKVGKENKVYSQVNVDFDGELHSFNTQEPEKFKALPKYVECNFTLFYGTYRAKDGSNQSYMQLMSAVPCK